MEMYQFGWVAKLAADLLMVNWRARHANNADEKLFCISVHRPPCMHERFIFIYFPSRSPRRITRTPYMNRMGYTCVSLLLLYAILCICTLLTLAATDWDGSHTYMYFVLLRVSVFISSLSLCCTHKRTSHIQAATKRIMPSFILFIYFVVGGGGGITNLNLKTMGSFRILCLEISRHFRAFRLRFLSVQAPNV